MESERMADSLQRLERYFRYLAAALVLLGLLALATFLLAWRMYSENIAPAVKDMRATMDEVHTMTVQTAALLEEAQRTMNEVRRTTSAVAPMMGQAQQTIQEAQQTTSQVQAPLNMLRAIPFVNWFMY